MFNFFKSIIKREQVLKECSCTPDDLTLQELHGKWYGGKFKCLKCGTYSDARVVNK